MKKLSGITFFCLGLLAFTNPKMQDYGEFIHSQDTIANVTVRSNYVFFSVYESGNGDSRIKFVGILNNFILISSQVAGENMVVIPAGEFVMGSLPQEVGRSNNEKQHMVRIAKAFALGKYEVTFEEYDRFYNATRRQRPDDSGWGRDKRPVINVSWDDAMAYTEWLSRVAGQSYRLPTEAEWEYAARAGTQTAYWWGDGIDMNKANCMGCWSQWDGKQTAPVGSFSANAFGLYDTAGNIWEWTCSAYNENYAGGEQSCVGNGPRVLRGGSWDYEPLWVRGAARYRLTASNRDSLLGFRLARTISP